MSSNRSVEPGRAPLFASAHRAPGLSVVPYDMHIGTLHSMQGEHGRVVAPDNYYVLRSILGYDDAKITELVLAGALA